MILAIIGVCILGLAHGICFLAMVERRFSREKNLAIYGVTILVFIVVSSIIMAMMWEHRTLAVTLAYMITAAEWFLVFFWSSTDPPCKKVFLFVNYGSLFCIMTSLAIILVHGLFPGLGDGTANLLKGILVMIGSIPVSLAYRKWLRPTVRALSGNQKKTWHAITLVSALFLVAFTCLLLVCRVHFRQANYIPALALTILIYCAGLCVVFQVIQYMEEKTHTELVQLNMEYLQDRLDRAQENELAAKTVRHDFHFHCQNLLVMLEKGEREEAIDYLRQYSDSLDGIKPRNFCGNATVNAILNHFAGRAENRDIEFTAAADTREGSAIANLDYVAILSNLLENAFSSCQEVGIGGPVQINLRAVGDKTVIVCSNPCREDLEIRDNLLVNRGVGVESILAQVRKYNGDIRYEKFGNSLSVCLILNS